MESADELEEEIYKTEKSVKAIEAEIEKKDRELEEQRSQKAPTTSPEIEELDKDIRKAQEAIEESGSDAVQETRKKREGLQSDLQELASNIAMQERIESDQKRVEELKEREVIIGQQLADIDKSIKGIDEYKKAESELVTRSVNDRFNTIVFKMFKYRLNGEIQQCCDMIYNGVPYDVLSRGEQITVGVDIIRTLSKHYGIEVPLFIDNAESLSIELRAEQQLVRLVMNESVETIQLKN